MLAPPANSSRGSSSSYTSAAAAVSRRATVAIPRSPARTGYATSRRSGTRRPEHLAGLVGAAGGEQRERDEGLVVRLVLLPHREQHRAVRRTSSRRARSPAVHGSSENSAYGCPPQSASASARRSATA
ncbi:hypothetical protein [Streptomyces sp. NPDC090022]|uniref:hypothetical protein n=1 Tax=Streptomyces sp. NPDC090022 TaxID=3365920 RepID=UPI003802CDB3